MLFGSILTLQVLAHLPLANVFLPASTHQYFHIMMDIFSFDYFPLIEWIDFGFTETEPWAQSFVWLDFQSINFMESMGSISLWIWIGILYAFFVLVLRACHVNLRNKKLRKLVSPMSLAHLTIKFMLGTLYEIMISASIGVAIFELHEYWNTADKINVAFQIFVSLMVLIFICFIGFFTICKIKKINVVERSGRLKRYKTTLKSVDHSFK